MRQVNHAPSFACGSPLDLKIKLELLRNTMRLIHLQAYHKKKFKQEQQALRQQRMQQLRGSHGPKPTIEDRERLRRQQQEIAQAAWVKHEEAALGNFERIYPDDEPTRAQAYERVAAGSVQLFGRSATNRRTAAQQVKVVAAKPSAPVKKLQTAAAAAAAANSISGDKASRTSTSSASSTAESSACNGSTEDGATPTGSSTGSSQAGSAPPPTAAAIAAAIANADDKAAAAIAAAACFLGMPAGSEGGAEGAAGGLGAGGTGESSCGLTGGFPANGSLPGCAQCAVTASASASSNDGASGSGEARNPFFRLANPAVSAAGAGATDSHDDSRGARPSPGVTAPAGASVGHIGALGVGGSLESVCTYGYGLHWRCPSINESTAISRRTTGGDDAAATAAANAGTTCAGATASSACNPAAGAARLELLARMEQLETRRKTQGVAGGSAAGAPSPASVANGECRMSPGLSRSNAGASVTGAGAMAMGAGGGIGGACAGLVGGVPSSASLEAQRALVTHALGAQEPSQSSPSSRRNSAMHAPTGIPRNNLPSGSGAGAARSVAEQRLSCSAGPTDTRVRCDGAPMFNSSANGARGDGSTRRAPGASPQNWHVATVGAPEEAAGVAGIAAGAAGAGGGPADADGDGWRVSGCWGFFPNGSGGPAPGARVRHTSSPQSDPWWVSRRQLNQLAGPPDRRRCTPPAGGFSLMPGTAAGSESGAATLGRDRAASSTKQQDTTSLQALQGARLHTLPMRARTQGRGN